MLSPVVHHVRTAWGAYPTEPRDTCWHQCLLPSAQAGHTTQPYFFTSELLFYRVQHFYNVFKLKPLSLSSLAKPIFHVFLTRSPQRNEPHLLRSAHQQCRQDHEAPQAMVFTSGSTWKLLQCTKSDLQNVNDRKATSFEFLSWLYPYDNGTTKVYDLSVVYNNCLDYRIIPIFSSPFPIHKACQLHVQETIRLEKWSGHEVSVAHFGQLKSKSAFWKRVRQVHRQQVGTKRTRQD